MAPHGAMDTSPLLRYGSHSLLGSWKKDNVHLMEETFTGFSELSIGTKSTAAYRQSRQVTVQLSVISGLHIASVVLVEVGQAVVHEDIALYERKDGIADRIRNQ